MPYPKDKYAKLTLTWDELDRLLVMWEKLVKEQDHTIYSLQDHEILDKIVAAQGRVPRK